MMVKKCARAENTSSSVPISVELYRILDMDFRKCPF